MVTTTTTTTSALKSSHSIYNKNNWLAIVFVLSLALSLLACCVQATPMLYKKNPHDAYEADLVPVSSTVIPLTVLEVSYGLGGKPSEEYKQAYLKKLRKKVVQRQQQQQPGLAAGGGGVDVLAGVGAVEDVTDADTLITVKSQQHDASGKAKVKGINI